MNKRWLMYFYIVVGFGLMLATPAWADFQAGLDAYERGDYETVALTYPAISLLMTPPMKI